MNFFGDKRFWYAIVAAVVVLVVAAVFWPRNQTMEPLCQRRQIHKRPRPRYRHQRHQNSNAYDVLGSGLDYAHQRMIDAKMTVARKFRASLSYLVATRRQSFRCENARSMMFRPL